MARDPKLNFAIDALAFGDKRKQIMTVIITIAAEFAVQIYAPAYVRLGRAFWAVAMSHSCAAVLPEMPELLFPRKPVKLKVAANFKARKTDRPKKCMVNMRSQTIF